MSKTSEVSYSEGTCSAISWINMGSCAASHIYRAIFWRQPYMISSSTKLRSRPSSRHSKCFSAYTPQSAQDLFNLNFIGTSTIEYGERSSCFLIPGGATAFTILGIIAANFSTYCLFLPRWQSKASTFFSMMLTQTEIQWLPTCDITKFVNRDT